MSHRNKNQALYLDSNLQNVTEKLRAMLPDATDLQIKVLSTMTMGYTTAVIETHVNKMSPTAYPNNTVSLKALYSTTTDGSAYMALIGNDGIEYMKVTVVKDSEDEKGLVSNSQIRFYQNPNNQKNQLLPEYAELKEGWDVIHIYHLLRHATDELMLLLEMAGLYTCSIKPNPKVVGYQTTWVQTSTETDRKNDMAVHSRREGVDYIGDKPANEVQPKPRQWGDIHPDPTKISIPTPPNVAPPQSSRTPRQPIPKITKETIKMVDETKEVVKAEAIPEQSLKKSSPLDLLTSAFDAINKVIEYNRNLDMKPSLRETKFFKLPFGLSFHVVL